MLKQNTSFEIFETPSAILHSSKLALMFCCIAGYFSLVIETNNYPQTGRFIFSFFSLLLEDSSPLHKFHPTGDIDSFISSELWSPFNFARRFVFCFYSLTVTNSNWPSELGTQSTWTNHSFYWSILFDKIILATPPTPLLSFRFDPT